LAEQFADADIGGRPKRMFAFPYQAFVEKQAGAFVRKDYGYMAEITFCLLI
jgi:hypothetical protein